MGLEETDIQKEWLLWTAAKKFDSGGCDITGTRRFVVENFVITNNSRIGSYMLYTGKDRLVAMTTERVQNMLLVVSQSPAQVGQSKHAAAVRRLASK